MSPFTGLNIKFMWRILMPDETVLTIYETFKRPERVVALWTKYF